jgi:hypothetical protein
MGCRCFHNYKYIIQASLDGQLVDSGEFPMLLGSYTTIPKAPCGGTLPQEHYFDLDFVHVDIAFGDCVLFGGFCHALIFVNRATCYNWVFSLKDLSRDSILVAFHLFQADAGSMLDAFVAIAMPNFLAL